MGVPVYSIKRSAMLREYDMKETPEGKQNFFSNVSEIVRWGNGGFRGNRGYPPYPPYPLFPQHPIFVSPLCIILLQVYFEMR